MITVNELRYEKTFNLGNYSSEKVGIAVALEKEENPGAILKKLMSFVETRGEGEFSGAAPGAVVQEVVAQFKTPVAKEVKAKEPKVQKPKAEKVTIKEPEAEAEIEAAAEEATEVVVEEQKKKVVKNKNTPYNRADSLHKALLSKMLDSREKNWRAKAAKAKEVSEQMAGVDFLSEEGTLLESFVTKFLESFKA